MPLRAKRHDSRFERKRPVEHNGLSPYLALYLEAMAVQGAAPDTLKRRDSALRRFIAWCDERALQAPHSITKPILERYQKHLFYYRKSNGEPLSFNSQHVLLTPLKSWFRWLCQHNHLPYNPASELVLPRKLRHLPRAILSIEEVEQVLAVPDTRTPQGIRDRAILETLYSTGVRRMELCQLRVDEVDARRGLLFVREGKGGRDRYVPIGARAVIWLDKYRHEVRPLLLANAREPALFLTDYGSPFARGQLTQLTKHYLRAAGIDKPGSCHLFRHAMATHMLDNGADIRFIQALLGHARLDTTQIYTQVSLEKLKQVHAATHPAQWPVTAHQDALAQALDAEARDEDESAL